MIYQRILQRTLKVGIKSRDQCSRVEVEQILGDHDKPVLGRIPKAINGTHRAGFLSRQTKVRGTESEAPIKANRAPCLFVEDLGLVLHQHGLQQHLAGMLKVQQYRSDSPIVIEAIERLHTRTKRAECLGFESSCVSNQLHKSSRTQASSGLQSYRQYMGCGERGLLCTGLGINQNCSTLSSVIGSSG